MQSHLPVLRESRRTDFPRGECLWTQPSRTSLRHRCCCWRSADEAPVAHVNAIPERAAFRAPGRGMFWMRRQLNLGSHVATAQSRVVGWSKSLSKSWAMLTALTERRCSADWCGNRGEGRWNTWTSFPGRNSIFTCTCSRKPSNWGCI